jgi:hypothetical protein
MRTFFLSLAFALSASVVACAVPSEELEDETEVEAEGISSTAKKYVGTYVEGLKSLKLQDDGIYVFDNGVRCVRAPCPSGDSGTWGIRTVRAARRGVPAVREVVLRRPGISTSPTRALRIDESRTPIRLIGTLEIAGTFIRQGTVARPPSCEATTCKKFERCELRQVQCVRAPCDPVPTCVKQACPTVPYINCMPGPGTRSEYCTLEGQQWLKANCPNVQIAY